MSVGAMSVLAWAIAVAIGLAVCATVAVVIIGTVDTVHRHRAPAPSPEDRDLARALLEHHGVTTRLDQAQEELAELIVALAHLRRGRLTHFYSLRAEIADVEIMLDQLVRLVEAEDPGAMDRMRARKRAKARATIGGE